ncbi:MAG: tRNA pseudouridine(55) synthase TruB [Micavibrio aeruginosavorus]|uniref:tRNA pseudouridine synthase B n=1 Tax=Micavibrio aeruginosavorus TaxID=349221 RepID=A0A2W5MTW8_9BACT|nr:MAG: tRNA pseudouridine(55) synthase TruB [Micavibrio aeruginosavorus]
MARRKKGEKIDGWVNLHKPVGITSTQALAIVKRVLNAQKAGHAGTLDPLASGILPLALGEATKTVPYVQDCLKVYNFEVTWGEQRTTDDAEGTSLYTSDKRPAREAIEGLLPAFIGDVEQVPPQFSAIKVDGERAYDLARDGEEFELKTRTVYIERFEIVEYSPEKTSFRCLCGKGTYVRSLARDLGQKLGCYGYISKLERASVGPFSLKNAISLDIFQNPEHKPSPEQVLLPLQTALDDIPVLALKEQEATRLKNGNVLTLLSKPDLERMSSAGIDWESRNNVTALTTFGKKAIALVEVTGPELHPIRIFNV